MFSIPYTAIEFKNAHVLRLLAGSNGLTRTSVLADGLLSRTWRLPHPWRNLQ